MPKNELNRMVNKSELVVALVVSFIGTILVVFVAIIGIAFIITTMVRYTSHIEKAGQEVILFNNSEKYNEAIYTAEHIKIRFAPDANYTNSTRFSDIAKLALANSYNQVGKLELAREVYLNIIGYTEEEYSALDYLDDLKEHDIEDLAIFMTYNK